MAEAGTELSESETEKAIDSLLSGKVSDEPEEETKATEPMEDVKGSKTAPKKAKAKSSPEIEAFFASFNKSKEQARDYHRNGKYDEAIDKFRSCQKILEKLKASNRGGVPAEEFATREALLNNNIAVCYKQKQDSTGVITYSTKVIESGVTDINILLKAYILRGFANEAVDKVKQAKVDWLKVKELQPDNIDATKALQRIESALKQDETQRKLDSLGEAIRGLEEFKKHGNEAYKASKHATCNTVGE